LARISKTSFLSGEISIFQSYVHEMRRRIGYDHNAKRANTDGQRTWKGSRHEINDLDDKLNFFFP